jgi:CHAD domain-containing protein
MSLQQVLDQIKTLDFEELQQVNRAVQEMLASQKLTSQRQAFYQVLQASGLVHNIKPHTSINQKERKLIEIQGKSISQTIIEERR